jgi:hypothetical protein
VRRYSFQLYVLLVALSSTISKIHGVSRPRDSHVDWKEKGSVLVIVDSFVIQYRENTFSPGAGECVISDNWEKENETSW